MTPATSHAQSDHARPGQRRQIDEAVGLLIDGVRQRIGQDQAGPPRRC